MKIQPLRDMLTIEVDKDDSKSKSGILLAREWEKLPHTGVVKAIGSQVTDVKVGDRVHFNRYAFNKVGENLFIGTEDNLNAIL